MRKTPLKIHPLMKSIESFQRSPLYQCKQQVAVDDNKLKKIGRNRLVIKEVPLPQIEVNPNKENKAPANQSLHTSTSSAHITLNRRNAKNLSFGQGRGVDMEQRLSRLVASQKEVSQDDNQKLREALLRKQFFIRDRKMLPQRNCMSSSSAKRQPPVGTPPEGVKNIRRLQIRRSLKSREGEEEKQLKPCQLAQRIAEEGRPETAPNASRHPVRSASLEDFLNEWKRGVCGE